VDRFSINFPDFCEVLCSHGGEYEDGCFLGCCGVWSGGRLPTFQKCLSLIVLTVEASTSETSLNFYQTKRRNNPEDIHLLPVFNSENAAFEFPLDYLFYWPRLLLVFLRLFMRMS
jgi:hypothetical protein